ncbi:MAG: hypothetical protein ABR963_03810 [Acidimicrobiales bacterium]
MRQHSELHFSDDRETAVATLESIGQGKGWCNVIPDVEDDVPDLQVNFLGMWSNRGVAMASLITMPERHGVAQPSSLGLLHSRGRLGRERVAALLDGAPFQTRQDHSQRGLVLEVPAGTAARLILDVMCSLTSSLCDYEMTGTWRLDTYHRD